LCYSFSMSSLLLIGCGNMGSAMLSRWLANPPSALKHFYVVEPNVLPVGLDGVTHHKDIASLPASLSPDVIVLAVKPQQMDAILPALAKRFGNKPTYLSIAAGKKIAFYETALGNSASIARAMPNTPAMIGEGISALVGNTHLSYEGRTLVTQLLSAVGETLWLDDESLMDVVTAISGSGPAYFFTFMAALVEAGVENGLAPEIAEKLVKQTAIGASLLASQSDESLGNLTKKVTSKGGTTEAALEKFLENKALDHLVTDAVVAAVQRAKTLG
jgi:pyrroline-5-carboxylate reductase